MWPHERSLVKLFAGKPLAVIGVNISEPNSAALKKVVEKENLTWRSFSDPRTSEGWGPIAKKWNLSGTPTIYLIDHKGVIRHKWVGGAREKVIDTAVEELIQEARDRRRRPKSKAEQPVASAKTDLTTARDQLHQTYLCSSARGLTSSRSFFNTCSTPMQL